MEDDKKTLKYNGEDIDLDVFLKALEDNYDSYLDYENLNAAERKAFGESYKEYIKHLKDNKLVFNEENGRRWIQDKSTEPLHNNELTYAMSRGKIKGEENGEKKKKTSGITVEEYENASDRKKRKAYEEYQPNQNIAYYMFRVLGTIDKELKNRREAKEKADKEADEARNKPVKFSFDENGFWKSFMHSLNPSGEPNLKYWLGQDEIDESTGKRGIEKRKNAILDYIEEYIKNLPENIDFSGMNNAFSSKESYVEKLNELKKALNDIVGTEFSSEVYAALEKLGSNASEYEPYLSTEGVAKEPEPEKTDEEKIKEYINKNYTNEATTHKVEDEKELNVGNENNALEDALNEAGITFKNLDNNEGEEIAKYFNSLKNIDCLREQFIELPAISNIYIMPASYNKENGTVLYFLNSEDGLCYGRIPLSKLAKKSNTAKDLLYGEVKKILEDIVPVSEKNGGALKMQDGGETEDGYELTDEEIKGLLEYYINNQGQQSAVQPAVTLREDDDTALGISDYKQMLNDFERKRAARSAETINDRGLRTAGGGGNQYSASGAIRGVDVMRIASLALDLASIIDPDGISSLCLAAGGWAGAAAADFADEDVSTGKALTNAAFDGLLTTLAFIPVVGGYGKMAKVVRTAKALSKPLFIAALGAGVFDMASNGPDIAKSFKKLMSKSDGTIESKMNFNDWRNILTAAMTVAGIGNMARGVRARSVAKREAVDTNKVAVEVERISKGTDGNETRTREWVNLEGDDAKKFREAAEGENIENAKKIIKGVNDSENPNDKFELATSLKQKGKGLFGLGEKESVEYYDFEKKMSDVYDFGKLNNKSSNYRGFTKYTMENPKKFGFMKENKNVNVNSKSTVLKTENNTAVPKTENNTTVLKTENDTKTAGEKVINATETAGENKSAREVSSATGSESKEENKKGVEEHGGKLDYKGNDFFDKIEKLSIWLKMHKYGLMREGGSVVSSMMRGQAETSDLIREARRRLGVMKSGGKFKKKIYKAQTPAGGIEYTFGKKGLNPEDLMTDGSYLLLGTKEPVDYSNLIPNGKNNTSRDEGALQTGYNTENYTSGQQMIDEALHAYQNANNGAYVTKDIEDFAKRFFTSPENNGKDVYDMLDAYNELVKGQYNFRAKFNQDHPEDYMNYTDSSVGAYNRGNKELYGLANKSKDLYNGAHGYSTKQENTFGESTAHRFVNITPEDVELDFSYLKDKDPKLYEILNGLVKDKSGMLKKRVSKDGEETGEVVTDVKGGKDVTDAKGGKGGKGNTNKRGNAYEDWMMYLGNLPDVLKAGDLSRTLRFDEWLNNQPIPFTLLAPYARHLQVHGDLGAIMRGNASKANLLHAVRLAGTADSAQNFAKMMDAYIHGGGYSEQGHLTNDNTVQSTRQSSNEQEAANQAERVAEARQNQSNLLQYNTTKLTNKAAYKRNMVESINNFNDELVNAFNAKKEKKESMMDSYMEKSIQNVVASDLAGAFSRVGIQHSVTPEQQALFDKWYNGEILLSSLSDEERRVLSKLISDFNEACRYDLAKYYSIAYIPYNESRKANASGSDGHEPTVSLPTEKEGGKLGESSEQVEVQKLRNRVNKLNAYQKALSKRVDTMEKDLDRMERSASKYVQGMKSKK